jgi:phage-related protein
MTDFTYVPDSVDESAEFAIDKVQFGDGYTSRTPMGINNGLRTWSLQFADRSLTDANAIRDFFVSKKGSTSFTWRPQGFTADVTVTCSKYSRPLQNRFINNNFVYTISAQFEETPL